jgi:hypothetical protein
MLGKLFGSNARVKLLKLFLLHPEEKYYIRQISRDLKLQLNSVRRELENLEKFGLLNSFQAKDIDVENSANEPEASKHEKKYFQANSAFVLFAEIKNLIVKAQVLYEKDFIEKIKKIGRIKLMILTGMFAGINTSPVDMLIVGKLNKNKLIRIIKELEHDLGRELNFTFMEPREFKYRRDMTDVFLYQILESQKIIVINEIGLV